MRVGLGAGAIGDEKLGERAVEALLEGAIERGVALIDTARSYGFSEERIGRFLRSRPQIRACVEISTKVGYGVPGVSDWTGECIRLGIDAALVRLAVDHLDLAHLHSCPLEILGRGEVIDALEAAVRAGKVVKAAYSGDGEALAFAIRSGRFTSIQASYNLCDRANAPLLAEARARGIQILLKRPLANAPWRFQTKPEAQDLAVYFTRWRALALDTNLAPLALAVRFAAFTAPADVILIGTRSLGHLEEVFAALDQGPLPPELTIPWNDDWPAMI